MESVQTKSSVSRRKATRKPENVAEFEQWEAKQKGDWNYEFYYGEITKKSGMKQSEFFLVDFLTDCFSVTEAKKLRGGFQPEVDVFVDGERKRVADLAYFNREQINAMARGGKEVPAFAIEILLKNEIFDKIEEKLEDYFDAGVRLVWYITTRSKKIYAYTSVNAVQIFAAGSVASATPVLPDFKVDIDKLFTPA